MRRLIAILALMLIGNVLSAQVQVSDTLSKNRFQVRINGTIKGNYSKGSCYADANSAGNIAIKFSGNDKLVTAYQSPSLYVINGQTSSNRDSVLNRLSVIMLDFQCSTPTPPEPTSYSLCGAPVGTYWGCSDTINVLDEDICGINSSTYEDTLHYLFQVSPAFLDYPDDITSFTDYPFNQSPNIPTTFCDDTANFEGTFSTCNYIQSFSLTFDIVDTTLNTECAFYDGLVGDYIIERDGLSKPLNIEIINAGNDSLLLQDYLVDRISPIVFGTDLRRVIGTAVTDIDLDTNIIYITAKPVKISETTYLASSFKIQQLEYADINAPVITESVYNPNSGQQTADFDVNEGRNTYCIRVEDTLGNIAYTIFQVTKTAI